MSVRLNSGNRRSQVKVGGFDSGAPAATCLPSARGCKLGPEAEACYANGVTITLEQYRQSVG